MKLWCALLLLMSAKCFAQYPFEKLPSIKYDTVSFNVLKGKTNYTDVAYAKYKDYRVELLERRLKDSSNILIYFKNKLIQKINGDIFVSTYLDGPLYIADYNHDGLIDFKIVVANVGAAGLASSRETKMYLLNKGDNKFAYIYFCDFFNNKERDIDHKGRYEVIAQSLAEYKGHNYWLFDLYNFRNDKLVNVSSKYGYPIAVPYLFKETFKPTNKIPRKELKRLSIKRLESY